MERKKKDTYNNEIFYGLLISKMRKGLGSTSGVQNGTKVTIVLLEFSN